MSSNMIVNNIMKALYLLGLVFALSLNAGEYYIAKTGNDSNAGTEGSPWLTLDKANSTLVAGDTVYIKDGEYEQVLQPANSGTSGSPITYKADVGHTPIITDSPGKTAIVLDNRSYIVVDGIDVTGKAAWTSANIDSFATFDNSHYNVIQNGDFEYAKGWAGLRFDGGSHHNKILNNTFDNIGTWDDPATPSNPDKGEHIELYCAYSNLIEGNTFTRAGHGLITINGYENVIRNNHFDNKWAVGEGNRAATITSRPESACEENMGYNVFEGNVVVNTLPSADEPETVAAVKVEGINHIIRGNFLYDNFNIVFSTAAISYNPVSQYNKIYHNTIYNNGGIAWNLRHYGQGDINDDNVFKNNIVYKNRQDPPSSGSDYEFKYDPIDGDPLDDNVVSFNAIDSEVGGSSIKIVGIGTNSLTWYESNHSGNFKDNIETAADFVSEDPQTAEDFDLEVGSSLIDAGDFLTETVGSGSGTVITVVDAGYFFDGYGIVTGDMIQVGSNNPVLAVDVDYSANTITLQQSIAWGDGDGVSLPYYGVAPDIGGREYQGGSINPSNDAFFWVDCGGGVTKPTQGMCP